MIYKNLNELYEVNIQNYKIYPRLHIYKGIQTCSHFLQLTHIFINSCCTWLEYLCMAAQEGTQQYAYIPLILSLQYSDMVRYTDM